MDEKSLSTKEKKVAIQAQLIAGGNPRKLSEKYGLNYLTVISYRNELRDGSAKKDVINLANTSDVVLTVAVENIKEQTAEVLPPKKAAEFNAAVDEMVEGIDSLKLMNTEFHSTITRLLSWANKQITDDMDIKTWDRIAIRIGELHKAIFATGTQVNVQQNGGGGNHSFTAGMVN